MTRTDVYITFANYSLFSFSVTSFLMAGNWHPLSLAKESSPVIPGRYPGELLLFGRIHIRGLNLDYTLVDVKASTQLILEFCFRNSSPLSSLLEQLQSFQSPGTMPLFPVSSFHTCNLHVFEVSLIIFSELPFLPAVLWSPQLISHLHHAFSSPHSFNSFSCSSSSPFD